jgi:hypothetical protein
MILSHLHIHVTYEDDAISTSDFIASNDGMVINNKVEMIMKEAVAA